MPERNLTVVQDEPKEVSVVRAQGQSLADDYKELSAAKPSVAAMRGGAKLLERAKEYINFVHGALDPGIEQARKIYQDRISLRSTLLRVPLDMAFGKQQMTDGASIEKQLLLIPKNIIATSDREIKRKADEERRLLEAKQRAEQEAQRALEVKDLEVAGNVEAAEDLKEAPLPPVILPAKIVPTVEQITTTQRYLVEGIEVTDHRAFNKWLSEQAADLNDKLSEVKKGGVAAYLNATAGAEIPGIRAQKSDVVTDRRK